MKDRTEKYIEKQQKRAHSDIISRRLYLSSSLEMLAIDYIIADGKPNTKKAHKNYQLIDKFINSLAPREIRGLFIDSFTDYIEICRDCDTFDQHTPSTLSTEITNLFPLYSQEHIIPAIGYIGVNKEDILLTKAKLNILKDHLSPADTKYIIDDIKAKYGEQKVPTFLAEQLSYQPQA